MAPPKKPSCLPTQPCVVRLLCDPVEYHIYDIEMVQHHAVRFICDLKGRVSISAAIDTFELDNLSERRKKADMICLLQFLSNEECHEALSYSYDELMNTRPPDMAVTRGVNLKQFMQNRQPITTASCPVQYGK